MRSGQREATKEEVAIFTKHFPVLLRLADRYKRQKGLKDRQEHYEDFSSYFVWRFWKKMLWKNNTFECIFKIRHRLVRSFFLDFYKGRVLNPKSKSGKYHTHLKTLSYNTPIDGSSCDEDEPQYLACLQDSMGFDDTMTVEDLVRLLDVDEKIDDREFVVLTKFIRRFSQKEIMNELNVSATIVTHLFQRSKEKLAKQVRKYGILFWQVADLVN